MKSRLGILADRKGILLTGYHVEIENDELIVLNIDTDKIFTYKVEGSKVPAEVQKVQEILFHEKQKLIENCLFGVDINANSVRICQLRLWIELLKCAYYRNGRVGELETLPSIDINIKCGNSVLSRYALDESLSSAFKSADLKVADYKALTNKYKTTSNMETKREVQSKIAKLKEKFQESQLAQVDIENSKLEQKLEVVKSQYAITGFDQGLEESTQQKRDIKIKELEKDIENLNTRRKRLQKSRTFNFSFEWRYEFPEILDDKGQFVGFDIIVTNPPYMRIQEITKIQPEQKELYTQKFPRTAVGNYDLANLFFELALALVKTDGNCIFIFPHKVYNSENGVHLRDYLLNERSVMQITHFGVNQIFDSATTYSCITLFNRSPSESFKFKRFDENEDIRNGIWNKETYSEIEYSSIEAAATNYGSNLWIFFNDPREYDLFENCYKSATKAGDIFESMFQGFATSRDSLFVCEKLNETKDRYEILVNPARKAEEIPVETRKFTVEKEFFKPLLMGRDVHRYSHPNTDRLVFFPYQVNNECELVGMNELASQYPLTHQYVKFYEESFKTRERSSALDYKEWYAFTRPNSLTKYQQEKLVSMELSTNHPNFTLDLNGTCHNTKVYGLILKEEIEQDYRFFLGILNSKLFWWFMLNTGDSLRGDTRTVSKNYMAPFPIPTGFAKSKETKLVDLVDKLLKSKSENASKMDSDSLEEKINTFVYKLYRLNEDEIELVENACSNWT